MGPTQSTKNITSRSIPDLTISNGREIRSVVMKSRKERLCRIPNRDPAWTAKSGCNSDACFVVCGCRFYLSVLGNCSRERSSTWRKINCIYITLPLILHVSQSSILVGTWSPGPYCSSTYGHYSSKKQIEEGGILIGASSNSHRDNVVGMAE